MPENDARDVCYLFLTAFGRLQIMKYEDHSYYHIYNRGAHKGMIFFSDKQYIRCLDLLAKYAEKYKVDVVAYCLMSNHYHLLLQQKENGSVSKCIQTMFNAYSQTVNVMEQHSGTLFQGKAKARLIDSDEYVLQVIRYIHLNPVSAELVQKPEDRHFSDYCEWIGIPNNFLKAMQPSEGQSRSDETFGRLLLPNFSEGDIRLRDTYFSTAKEYQRFVEEYWKEQQSINIEKFLFIEE